MASTANQDQHSPWNPGLRSDMPRDLLPLVTLYRPENVFTDLVEATELSQFCGIESHALVALRPERLIVHEILVRITADLGVYDGRRYEDLGVNFRRMAATIYDRYVEPHLDALNQQFIALRDDAATMIEAELAAGVFRVEREEAKPKSVSLLQYFRSGRPRSQRGGQTTEAGETGFQHHLDHWSRRSAQSHDELERSCLTALYRVVCGIAQRHGRLIGDADLVARIAINLVTNDYGSHQLGRAIEPYISRAIEAEGFHRLPPQDHPVVMNTKGASASGKSTMRPQQHELADRLDLPWQDFSLISPDIWRKFLLDYDSLGPAYKYAGMMTGHEIEIIDRKLDRYMASKAAAGRMSHLLIDRFRFDSFVPEFDGDGPARLLTRFGDLVYMFFMVTPPEATVERAWRRGQMVGRYKAVDDLLAHNIEAYTGMPELFFTWALRTDKRVHYEFLDNSVALGERPATIAFGWNGEMNILDVQGMLNIDRFAKVNVQAQCPDDVYKGHSLAAADNTSFLRRCARHIPILNFADKHSGRIFARLENGHWVAHNADLLAQHFIDRDVRAALEAIGFSKHVALPDRPPHLPVLSEVDAHTIGAWGSRAQNPSAGSFAH